MLNDNSSQLLSVCAEVALCGPGLPPGLCVDELVQCLPLGSFYTVVHIISLSVLCK